MADKKNDRKHLFYLNELSDYKVDSDDPDVRGWPVKDADNRTVGKVDNLLVSKAKKRVVYLDVEVDKSILEANHDPYGKSSARDGVHEFINKDGENHLILPIGLARLNVDEKYVYTDRIDHQTFAETKRMEKGYDVDREYEVVVLESYNRDRQGKKDYDLKSTGDRNDRGNVGTAGTTSTDTSRTTDTPVSGVTGTTGKTMSGTAGTGTAGSSNPDLDAERRKIQEADRDKPTRNNLADRDRDLIDRDRGAVDEKRHTSESPAFDHYEKEDSFYDRGEFDRTKYRSKK